MSRDLLVLVTTAAYIGFFHTLIGPDHYLPFVVMAQSRKWPRLKTAWITILCGIGHVLSSVVLGGLGIAFGIAVTRLEIIESFRGNLAAWALIAFGLVYFIWGLRRAIKRRPHTHSHIHDRVSTHEHTHTHEKEHTHVHQEEGKTSLTPWVLFTIFVLGPCEPLIPILMYPAAKSSVFGVVMVAGTFGIVTILTMLTVVLLALSGLKLIPIGRMERYSHALAGAAIFLSGMAIQLLGL
ncbi:sulfite exporter TauE/SafE family protein [Candidatus Poribacteria bacterium]